MSAAADTSGSAAGQKAPEPTVKFHVVLGGGPLKGTFDLASSDVCLAGIVKPGSWNARWEAEGTIKDKISAVLVGIDPKPTYGNGLTAFVTFGQDDDQVMYELLTPVPTVADRGRTATLTFKGKARVAFYKDGSFADGGDVTITVECSKEERAP